MANDRISPMGLVWQMAGSGNIREESWLFCSPVVESDMGFTSRRFNATGLLDYLFGWENELVPIYVFAEMAFTEVDDIRASGWAINKTSAESLD